MERKKVRIITFAIAAFAILVGALIYQYSVSQSYLNYIRNSNMRSFYDFVDYVKTIDSSLEKGIHSNSPNQLVNISSEIWREAGGAQASLAQLPLSSEQTADVSKFLAQTGDYAYMLSKKVANNEVITPQEQDQLEELSRYAKALTSTLFEMEDQVNSGNVDLNNFNFSGQYQDVSNVDKGIGLDVNTVVEEFADYPSLIYDGPFSDHLLNMESSMLKDLPEISEEQARERAAYFLGLDPSQVESNGKGEGNIKTYSFKTETDKNSIINIDITRQGGYLVYVLNSRQVDAINLTAEECVQKAIDYLKTIGIEDMKESYYYESNNILTVNFAYEKNNVTYYRDLVKVTIAMDNGEVLGVECAGYLISHRERDPGEVLVSEEQARTKLSSRLTETSHKLAAIPTDFGTEVLCHEFVCKNNDGRNFIVYINAKTGQEEQIFMLIESPNGTLAI